MKNTKSVHETPHYFGQSDITLDFLITLINQIEDIEWFSMCASNALRGMEKQR